jgi:hypothetical protein
LEGEERERIKEGGRRRREEGRREGENEGAREEDRREGFEVGRKTESRGGMKPVRANFFFSGTRVHTRVHHSPRFRKIIAYPAGRPIPAFVPD